MQTRRTPRLAALGVLLASMVGAVLASPGQATTSSSASSTGFTVLARGLDNPRGLEFGPDGKLYVAEGGRGGTKTTVGKCTQVPAPIGPETGGFTARISRIDKHGHRTTVASGLPSSQTSKATGALTSGVADVAFLDGKLYALISGAGCSHGLLGTNNAVVRVLSNGKTRTVANLSAYLKAHPVAHPEAEDFEPDGTWWSLVAAHDALYAVEPNHGELDRISPSGHVSRVVDVSATQGHIVPTALVVDDKTFRIGNLGVFPVKAGTEKVLELKHGKLSTAVSGLTTVLGLAERHGWLYVLETTTVSGPGPTPGKGAVIRISPSGKRTTIASGLTFPTGLTFGPDGDLYVSNFGFGFPPGSGQVVKVHVPH